MLVLRPDVCRKSAGGLQSSLSPPQDRLEVNLGLFSKHEKYVRHHLIVIFADLFLYKIPTAHKFYTASTCLLNVSFSPVPHGEIAEQTC